MVKGIQDQGKGFKLSQFCHKPVLRGSGGHTKYMVKYWDNWGLYMVYSMEGGRTFIFNPASLLKTTFSFSL